jgi:hypothetical protein
MSLGKDDDQERKGDSRFLAKEHSWHNAWRARSLLSRTKRNSAISIAANAALRQFR